MKKCKFNECYSHYHFVYSKKIPNGNIQVDVNILTPSNKIVPAMNEAIEMIENDILQRQRKNKPVLMF